MMAASVNFCPCPPTCRHGLSGADSAADKRAEKDRQKQASLKAVKAVEAVVKYCETPGCRRKTLLEHFGETSGKSLDGNYWIRLRVRRYKENAAHGLLFSLSFYHVLAVFCSCFGTF